MDVAAEFGAKLDCVGGEVNVTWVEDNVIVSVGVALVKELHRRKTVFDGSSVHVSDSTGSCGGRRKARVFYERNTKTRIYKWREESKTGQRVFATTVLQCTRAATPYDLLIFSREMR